MHLTTDVRGLRVLLGDQACPESAAWVHSEYVNTANASHAVVVVTITSADADNQVNVVPLAANTEGNVNPAPEDWRPFSRIGVPGTPAALTGDLPEGFAFSPDVAWLPVAVNPLVVTLPASSDADEVIVQPIVLPLKDNAAQWFSVMVQDAGSGSSEANVAISVSLVYAPQ